MSKKFLFELMVFMVVLLLLRLVRTQLIDEKQLNEWLMVDKVMLC